VREIVAYARDRGIRVVPEFDMPGHTTALLAAYPELGSAPGPYKIERSWGVFDPCMDPTREKLYSFLDTFIDEMAGLFPDEYFHIGGDEVNGRLWNANPGIRSFKKRERLQNNHDLQAYFNRRLSKILAGHGKKMIGWDEIFHPDLPDNIVIQSWRGQASLANGARQGYHGILSYGYYLDHMQPASFHYQMDPLGGEAAKLGDEEKSRVLGGEACMWGEFVSPDNIDSRIWPRTAAIAERLWSPSEVRDIPDMYRRLEFVSRDLDWLGLTHQTGYIGILRRMVGDQHVGLLKSFADVLKPTGLGIRQRSREYTNLTPLNRMADAVLPESPTARKFESLVLDAFSGQPAAAGGYYQIRQLMAGWRENESRLDFLLGQSELLMEIRPLLKTVMDLSERGLQALDYMESGRRPPEAWQRETALLLDLAGKPQAEVLPAIIAPIRSLIEAASAIP
jgi:hexosaminidase